MRHPDRMLELFRYLMRLGLSPAYTERVGLEIRDHWRDIAEEAQLKGASEEEAAEIADLRLGDPDEIARSIVVKVRESRWAGRHPVVAFVMVPIPLFFFAAGLSFSGAFWILSSLSAGDLDSLVMACWSELVVGVTAFAQISLGAVAMYICSWSRRCHRNWGYSFAGCFGLALKGLCLSFSLSPPPDGSLGIGYSTRVVDPGQASIPLLACGLFWVWEAWSRRTLLKENRQ